MLKLDLVKEILARAGDPNAQSETFRSLCWSLFVETAYELSPSMTLVESKYLIKHEPKALSTDGNGRTTGINMTWAEYLDVAEVWVLLPTYYVMMPAQLITPQEYGMMLTNPFYRPCAIDESKAVQENIELYYYYDGKYLYVITGTPLSTASIQLRTYPDLRLALGALDSGSVPLHNATIAKAIPLVAAKLKQEIGLIL